jgi:hypothetical protein
MAGGQRIDDHASFAGKGGKYPLPVGNKMKEYRSAEGAGKESDFDDTSEAIHRDQQAGASKLRGKQLRPGYRY